MQIIYYLLLFIGLVVFGYLLLKINDKISYGKAYKLLEKIDEELKVKQKALEKETIFYDEKYKQLLDILSNSTECDITKIPKNTKLIDIFCIKKNFVGEAKNIKRLIYTPDAYYCPKANNFFIKLEALCDRYKIKNPKNYNDILNKKPFLEIMGDDDLEFFLDMNVEEFLKTFYILIK
jgi:hypothetical protein